jgi:hypothetical protein
MIRLALFVGCLMGTVALAQTPASAPTPAAVTQPPRPTPPTRSPDGPGAPAFTRIPSGNAPADTNGDFVIGPNYSPPPELTVSDAVPQGSVQQFTMKSGDSKFYPGIARDVFGTVDPNNPKTLIVDTHAQPWQRSVHDDPYADLPGDQG